MRLINYINGIEGVGAGNIATVNIPVARRYHALKIFTSATGQTDPVNIIDWVRVLVNGTVMRDLTPGEIKKICALNGITPATGEVPIFFSEPWRATVIGEEATSWDVFGQTKMTMEIKFKTGLTGIACAVEAAFDYARNIVTDKDGKESLFLAIIKHLKQNYNAPSGSYDVTTLQVKFPIQRLLMTASTGTLTQIEVRRDSEIIQESLTAQNSAFLKDYDIDASQFSYPILFDFTQQQTDALTGSNFAANPSGIRDLLVKVWSSDPNTLTIIQEYRANGYV